MVIMETESAFDVNDALKCYLSDPATIPTAEADGTLVDCENDPETLTSSLINGVLNPIVDAVAENPEALSKRSSYDSLAFLLKCAPIYLPSENPTSSQEDHVSELFAQSRFSSFLSAQVLSKVVDLITSGLSAEADIIHNELEAEEQDESGHQKHLLEMYAFLLQWCISVVEVKAADKTNAAPAKPRGGAKGSKTKTASKEASWDSSAQLQSALETMCKVLKLRLGKIFVTTSERDTFVGLFTRPVYLILESEQRIKNTALRMHAFKVLCIAVKHHGHAFGKERLSDFDWK